MPPTLTDEVLVHWFTHHPPSVEQALQHQAVRDAGLAFARAIVTNAPPSADTTAAIRKVREAVATANMAIACGGK